MTTGLPMMADSVGVALSSEAAEEQPAATIPATARADRTARRGEPRARRGVLMFPETRGRARGPARGRHPYGGQIRGSRLGGGPLAMTFAFRIALVVTLA